MGVGSYFADEFGDGGDDYKGNFNQNGQWVTTHPWFGYDANAAGTAPDQATQEASGTQDRNAVLAQAAGVNQTAAGMDQSATRIGQTAQTMDRSAGALTGLSDQLGTAPSAAAAASTAAMQTGNAQALSQAATARGANSALMMREAASNNDARDRSIASDAATAAANEQASRYATRGNLLSAAAGVQNNEAGAYGGQASALGGAAAAQSAAGGLVSGSRTADIAQRGQDITNTQNVNQLTQQHDDAMYAGMVAKHNKDDSDEGGALDSAFSAVGMGSDIRLKTDVEPISSTASSSSPAAPADKSSTDSGGGTSSMLTSLLAAYAGGGGGAGAASMASDARLKTDRRQIESDKATGSALTKLLEQATRDDSKRLDTNDVGRRFDRGALDDAQRAEGSRVYGSPAGASSVPTARFADYAPPTARFADAPASAPAPAAPPPQQRDPGFDVAALDDAYRRERDPSQYMVSDKNAKTDMQKLLEMASDPGANKKSLEPVDGYTYRYKPDAAKRLGEDTAPRPGVMAQDLEKSPAGAAVVSEGPDGKMLDVHRAVGFSLAGVAGLDKRLKLLEQAIGKKSKAA